MNHPAPSSSLLHLSPEDDLAHLEMQVARRADSLAAGNAWDRGADLARWLHAEREVLAQLLPDCWAHVQITKA